MTEPVDDAIRRAIGGDPRAIAWLAIEAERQPTPIVVVMCALLRVDPTLLSTARHVATETRDRQLVELARAHLAGDALLVDALARDHLVDYPNSIVAAWIAAGAHHRVAGPAGPPEPASS